MFILFVFLVIVCIAIYFFVVKKNRWGEVCACYNLPQNDVCLDKSRVEKCSDTLRNVIEDAISHTNDPDKLCELRECLRAVRGMDCSSYSSKSDLDEILRAFQYSGCKIRIEDTNRNTIANIC